MELESTTEDQDDFHMITRNIAYDQLQKMLCDTLVELLTFGVLFAFIWTIVILTDSHHNQGSHCHLVSTIGCPSKAKLGSH